MVLDIQTVHHILKNTAVQHVNKPFVYITDLTSTLNFSFFRFYFYIFRMVSMYEYVVSRLSASISALSSQDFHVIVSKIFCA